MDELLINHNAGFFSCCSVRLANIINFFNLNKRLPKTINWSQQFSAYKNNEQEDINDTFFAPLTNIDIKYQAFIDYHWDHQFIPYNRLDLERITPFISKFFNVSDVIKKTILQLEQLYNIDYSNTIAVFYRGNDKVTETKIGNYEEYFKKADELYIKFPNSKFLVQTDELEFREEFIKRFKNSFYFKEIPAVHRNNNIVIHNIIEQSQRKLFAILFLAATICVSKCQSIITHSGNCGIWSILYRGNLTNVYQYINHNDTQGWQKQ